MRHLLLTTALLCSGAQAQFFTGNDLLARINSDVAYDRGLSMGFVIGVYDATLTIEHCPPANVTAGQVRDMVSKSLNSGAAARHLPAEAFVIYTLGNSMALPQERKGRMTKDEALDLALKALEACIYPQQKQLQAITAIKQARALDKMAENARKLGLTYDQNQE